MSNTTKRALAESFKQIMKKTPFDKITVKNIVEGCGVNRQTFYYHFHDIYDLVEWTLQGERESSAEDVNYDDWVGGIETLIQYLQRNRDLVTRLYYVLPRDLIADYMKKEIRPYASVIVSREAEHIPVDIDEADVRLVTEIFTLGAAGLVEKWICAQKKGDTVDIGREIRKIKIAMDGGVEFMLRNLSDARS